MKSEKQALKEIEAGAIEVRAAGTKIAERIAKFEAWLNTVPGRVRTNCELWRTDDGDGKHLCFAKEGKGWALFLYDYATQRDEILNWTPLRDASLDLKVQAVAAFPRLLEAMSEAQRRLVARVHQTASVFDEFAKSIGMKEGA